MRKAAFVLIAFVFSGAAAIAADTGDLVACRVQGEAITKNEIIDLVRGPWEKINSTVARLRAEGALTREKADDLEVARRKFFRQGARILIRQKLLLLDAREKKISISKDDVQKRLDALIERYGGFEPFKELVGLRNKTLKEIKREVKNVLTVEKVKQWYYLTAPRVSPARIIAYYNGHPDEFKRERSIKAQIIAIRKFSVTADGTLEPRDTKKIRAEIAAALKAGKTFAYIAEKYSDDEMTKYNGGVVMIKGKEYFTPGKGGFLPPLDGMLATMKAGEVSTPIETDQGFCILRVADVRPPGVITFREAQHEIREKLQRTLRKKVLDKALVRLASRISVVDSTGEPVNPRELIRDE